MRTPLILIAALMLVAHASAKPHTATLLYITDAHEVAPVVDRLGDRGGVARLKTVVDHVRRGRKDAQLLFGGDLAGGVLFGALFHGMPVVEAFNIIGVDAATFGQHDFDFGADQTRQLVAASRFPWFTTNLVDSLGEVFDGLPRTLVITSGGLRIGLIGLTDAMETTSPGSNVHQRDLLAAARDGLEELRGRRMDAVVALTQTSLAVNVTLLDSLPEIVAILTEERDETHSMVQYVGERPIASPGGNLASMIRLDLTRHQDGTVTPSVQAIRIGPGVAEDLGLREFADRYMQALSDSLDVPVAILSRPLESAMYHGREAYLNELMAGNLIADAFRMATDSDIGLIQGGGIRAALPAGELTRRGVLSLLPFGNRVCVVRIKGSLIRKALEHGVGDLENHPNRVLQVSGLTYSYDSGKAAGSRVTRIDIDGVVLAEDSTYTAALPDYLLRGGDDFDVFAGGVVLVGSDHDQMDAQVLEQHCRSLGVISPALEGRIQAVAPRD
ncbi:MAG: 5'-nucleotidase C-terminal domain-containing protein [bacterium]